MKPTSWPALFALSILFSLQVSGRAVSEQDQLDLYSFVSRPDIKAPKWNISVYDEQQIAPGYWFVGTYDPTSRSDRSQSWTGPHIYDQRGQLIWSGAKMSSRTGMVDFQLRNINGEDVMTIYRPDEGRSIHLNDYFEKIEESAVGGTNLHETSMVNDEQHALVIEHGARAATSEMSRAVGLEHGSCMGDYYGFKEVDTTTGVTSFQWNSQRHIALNESTMEGTNINNRCNRREGWDYLHINAVSKCPDGDYIISGQHTDTIYKISHKDGSIIWRLGGKINQFRKGALSFSRQSHLQCLSTNLTHTIVSVLDNARSNNYEDRQFPSYTMSRALILSINVENMQTKVLKSYPHPLGRGYYASDRSTLQILSDSHNAFVAWTNRSLLTEYTPSGTLVQRAELLPTWLNTFKTYKFDFIGLPSSPPDLFAQAGPNKTTHVYVSWNGATEVYTWKLYRTNPKGSTLVELISEPRTSFETAFELDGFHSHIVAEAFSYEGLSLGQSAVFATLLPAEVLAKPVEEQMEWLRGMEEGEGVAVAFVAGFLLAVGVVGVVFWFRKRDVNVLRLRSRLRRRAWWDGVQQYIPLSPGRKTRPFRMEVEEI